jgi:predicted phosphodiesterase
MRLGILSDIHANYEALVSSFKALETAGCDKYVCTGDIVGYGACPKECIDFIRSREIATVKGNHDSYTTQSGKEWDIQPYAKDVIKWTQDILRQEDIEWLDKLPYKLEVEGIVFVHASLEALDGEYWPYILDTKSALFHFFLQDVQFAFFGHVHIPLLFSYDENQKISIEILRSKKIINDRQCKYLINPGSVGQPRDFDSRSSSVIFDTESMEITVIRSEYDIAKTQEQILSAGLPKLLAARLSRGN